MDESIYQGPFSFFRFLYRLPNMTIPEILSCLFLLIFLLMAVFPGLIAPYNPNDVNLSQRLITPGIDHICGTDQYGRDIFSRIVFGSQTSLFTAFSVVAIGVGLGTALGLVAGFFGGAVDQIIMRAVDLFLAFPGTILAIAIVGMLGPSLFNIVLALAAVWWVQYARIVRGSVLQVKEKEFIAGAKLMGGGPFYIIKRHILPNVLSPIIALASLDIGSAILHITGLSFLGLGAQPPTPEWGAMIQGSIAFMESAPQTMIFPGICIMITVLSFNCLGDKARDLLDPVRRREADID
jgi:peptide/nickel transport system permease protein